MSTFVLVAQIWRTSGNDGRHIRASQFHSFANDHRQPSTTTPATPPWDCRPDALNQAAGRRMSIAVKSVQSEDHRNALDRKVLQKTPMLAMAQAQTCRRSRKCTKLRQNRFKYSSTTGLNKGDARKCLGAVCVFQSSSRRSGRRDLRLNDSTSQNPASHISDAE
jgi:hypothetical protein